MEQNVGLTDRYIRITLGGMMLAASAARMVRDPGLGGALGAMLGGMMLAEGVLGTCPLYSVYGINTARNQQVSGTGAEPTNDVISPCEGI